MTNPSANPHAALPELARQVAPTCQHWSLRAVTETTEHLSARQGIVSAPRRDIDSGVMVAVALDGATAYAATADVSKAGLSEAFGRAKRLAGQLAGRFEQSGDIWPEPPQAGQYQSPLSNPIPAGLDNRIAAVVAAAHALKIGTQIVDWTASLSITRSAQLFITDQSEPLIQSFHFVVPNLQAVARANGRTQTRTLAGQYNGYCRQGGWEILTESGFSTDGARIANEAVDLCHAPNCPTGAMDVVLMPDQMMLQIHESIGHPLELDRILGDERNFAGTSFVNLEMFGTFQYGSEHLNVSYAPDVSGQFASFAYDDEGSEARRTLLIEQGVLKRPLGGASSVKRISEQHPSLEAVATTRASSWNRAPIDRMSNLNIEPGASSLEAMISATTLGVLMRTNCSWSIDDSRNKFQFGCEFGQMIRDGKLAEVVRNPNYRGVSSTFWRSLAMVGNPASVAVMGTPYCGKGEPMQVIRVGHASPPCRFTAVEVFGGGE